MVRSVLPAANNLPGLLLYIDYFECSVAFDSDEELPARRTHGESVRVLAGLDGFSHAVLRTVDDGHAVAVRVGNVHKVSPGIDGQRLRPAAHIQGSYPYSFRCVDNRYRFLAVIRAVEPVRCILHRHHSRRHASET